MSKNKLRKKNNQFNPYFLISAAKEDLFFLKFRYIFPLYFYKNILFNDVVIFLFVF